MLQHSSRPLTHQRPPLSNSPVARQSHARTNSSLALNTNHRITRRKSVTNSGPNVAALTAALPVAAAARRTTASKATRAGSLPSPPASLPSHKTIPDTKESAIDDEPVELSGDDDPAKAQNPRVRRASDGQPLNKDGKKNNRIEVRCEKCGKGYKHSSCLTKHLWEHTPEWSYTSKLLISKHQQVQLLEAASVLVAMNGKESLVLTPPDSTKDSASEPDSASPAASPYSELGDGPSSADTTPPPTIEGNCFGGSEFSDSTHGDLSPRHLQPWFASRCLVDGPGRGLFRQLSHDSRPPSSSGASKTGQEDRDLAAAVELLSCSFRSKDGPHGNLTLVTDAPPVPPLPAQYLDQATSLTSAGFISSFPSRQPESFTRGEMRRDSVDVKMEDSGDDDDFDMRYRARSDDDDDGVFGRMEE
ncbi:hypothetical protein XA68_17918 [Ophiocordyceps unilateralis]|uniref:C2H2-type domain-containing protein n=1 Tax=Ophiocordyceps unilateralis TaxID=268505 RepID=A0A2A9P2H2_OPHUN|nr:hypothetical protein XA68_17918 [Ophiocordyceps unilateralis]